MPNNATVAWYFSGEIRRTNCSIRAQLVRFIEIIYSVQSTVYSLRNADVDLPKTINSRYSWRIGMVWYLLPAGCPIISGTPSGIFSSIVGNIYKTKRTLFGQFDSNVDNLRTKCRGRWRILRSTRYTYCTYLIYVDG